MLTDLRAPAKRQGLWALGHPEEIGGGGLPFMDFVPLNEVIGRSELGQLAVGSVSMQNSIMLHRYGSQEQRRRWLEPMVQGDVFPSVGLTEPEVAGSDPTLMQSSARLEGDQWVVDAHKWFTTGANGAAFTTVFCETDPDARSPYRRFSAILVPTDAPGYEVVRVVPTMSHLGGGHCQIRLTDVRVPSENLLGGRGEGFVIAQKRLGPRSHLPLHALAGTGTAGVRADVCACRQPLRARFAAVGEGRGPALRRRVRSADPVLGTLKWGVMCHLQARAHLGGHSRSVELAVIGRRGCENEYDLLRMLP